ncbi:MAG: 2OG-Fe(II) oxygenase [Candidatus Velthaea sp.]
MTARLAALDSSVVAESLFANGYALVPGVLAPQECGDLRACYDDDALFRSRIVMEKHNFGRGEYRYFGYPLPPSIETLRQDGYAKLAPLANRWMQELNKTDRFPLGLQEMLALCNAHEQARPTALILKYGAGDFNCLHQDLYGEIAFPLQMTFFLNEPGVDYTGGEFVLAETRPRSQTRVEVLTPRRGDLLVFSNRYRPVAGARGTYRAAVRHGVSAVRGGERYTLGIIFHDAR